MIYGDECYIVYDKFGGGTHSFTNPLTSKYKIKELFEIKMEEKGTEYLTGMEAINKFNEKFNQGNFNLPNNINTDIFSVNLFSFTDADNCEIMITVIGIDIKNLTDIYYKNNCDIPNKDFIISTCRFHNSYENSVYQDDDFKYEKNIKNIIESALTPKCDVLDPIIENPDFINSEKKLYNYQKRSIKWMYETEIKKKRFIIALILILKLKLVNLFLILHKNN